MAYNPVAQADRDVLSEESNSPASGSPPLDGSFHPISMDFGNLGGDMAMVVAVGNEHTDTRLGSMMRSLASTGTSYDMLDDDDYDETAMKKSRTSDLDPSFTPDQPYSSSGRMRTASIGPKLPLRHPTPDLQSVQGAYIKNVERLEESAERLSMNSSLEGELQKMKFEQRREQTESAAVGGARPVHPPSRQVSAASLSNSRSGIKNSATFAGYPSARNLNSPRGSVLSGSHSHTSNPGRLTSKGSYFAQPATEQEARRSFPEDVRQHVSSVLGPPQPPPHTYHPESQARSAAVAQSQMSNDVIGDEVRPSTSASNDTYRQATSLFVDFDGVHYASLSHLSPSRQGSVTCQFAINQPPLAADGAAFKEPPASEGMVYYPAPVPMMLNLPQKLSKQPSPAERERRRLQALSAMPSEMRKSAAWLNEMEKTTSVHGTRTSQALSSLPPQLRASAFFDQPGLGQDIDIKCASAVETLDSILDASAHAPVSAFTDHPFAGHLGGDVYGRQEEYRKSTTLERKKKRRSSITNLLRTSSGLTLDTKDLRPKTPTGLTAMPQNKLTKRRSKMEVSDGEADFANGVENPLHTSPDSENGPGGATKPDEDDLEDDKNDEQVGDDDGEDEEPDIPANRGAPTTLLAELQMRKAQQKLRNRTAANSFPNGMHSTLLELDAVAQFQQKSRKKKHVTLAWEDREMGDQAQFDDDDDDIPLGLLVVGQKAQQNINRPMGLMEKRDMEDNEPLSRRRARLRGDAVIRSSVGPSEQQRANTMYTLDAPALAGHMLEETEGETLAQRVQRIKAEKGNVTGLGNDFSKDVLNQLGLKTENVAPASTTPEAEETLGQRRKRLQEEALKGSRQPNGGNAPNSRGVKSRTCSMADILSQHPAATARQPSYESKSPARFPHSVGQYDSRLSQMPTFQQPMMNTYTMPGMMPSYPSFTGGMPFANGVAGFNYNNPIYSPGLAMQMGGYGHNAYVKDQIMMGPPLDPKQRDVIDQWRQGVAPS
jgi:hypothetical protein